MHALTQLKADLKEHSIRVVPPGEEFTLSSGEKSNIYCDLKQTAQKADCMINLSEVIGRMLPKDLGPTAFAGVALGGCHLASIMGVLMRRDVVYVRKEAKSHGMKKLVEAPKLEADHRIVLLEDVTTTAKSARNALLALREEGYNVVAVLTVVDRRQGTREATIEGVPLIACVDLFELMPQG